MNRKPWLVASLAMMAATSAQANRPLTTDTADTILHHRCQFEPYLASIRGRPRPSSR